MNNPFISVIVPVYNVEQYLRRALDSILSQTFEDFEIICVDDCSTDSSFDILKNYQDKDPRIKLFRNEKNQGAGYTKNFSMKQAIGKYLCFVDSDDWIVPGTLQELSETALKYDVDDIFYLSGNVNEGDENEPITTDWSPDFTNFEVYDGKKFLEKMIEKKRLTVGAVHQFCRRNIALSYASFSEHTINDDLQFSANLLCAVHTVLFLNKCFYVYFHRKFGSITNMAKGLRFCNECVELGKSTYESLLSKYGLACENVANKLFILNTATGINESFALQDSERTSFLKSLKSQKEDKSFFNLIQAANSYSLYTNLSVEKCKKYNDKKIYLFGTGNYSMDIFKVFNANDIQVHAFVVSKITGNKTYISGIPVYDIDSVEVPNNSCIIIATSPKYYDEILSIHKIHEFSEIIFSKDL